ncbi:BTB/POZ domain-containing protein 6-like [Phlebotomus papatasi]|uniref:BTB/POZ domain-containing protein 6-like n=1 Tax=Phlebotomus papatasi TaxID=29031 RepID=UPI00248373B2|nr:BTB/POZ domain-containing protein 6-like [Phlebotomus papatasi]XP_055705850.1 BTB/POZ domain-containing protein 6-like [Phlebotomus papatasi]
MDVDSANSIEAIEAFWSELESIEERLSKFICNEFLSDMTFLVGKERKRVPGHKFILNSCSWQFYNAFNLLKLDKDEFLVEDVSYEAFLEFLKYCYTGKVDLDNENAIDIYILAQRFKIDPLLRLSEDHVSSKITGETCLKLYSEYLCIRENPFLNMKILDTIANNFSYLMRREDSVQAFIDLPLDALRKIANSDLECDEMQLFDSLMKWAIHNCIKTNIPPVPKNLRKILHDVFYKISLRSMKMKWILEILAKYPGLLMQSEIVDIYSLLEEKEKIYPKGNQCKLKFSINSLRIDISLGEMINPCFTKELQVNYDWSSQNQIKFKSSILTMTLLGYGFIVKRSQEIPNITYEIRCLDRNFSITNVGTVEKRHRISWDYELVIVRFQEKVKIRPHFFYNLDCKYDVYVPRISKTKQTLCSNITGIQTEIDDNSNFIPYLIFNFF